MEIAVERCRLSIASLAPHGFFLEMDVGLGFMLTNGRLMHKSISNTETQDASVQIGPSSVQMKSDPAQKVRLLITPLCHRCGSHHLCSGSPNRVRLQTNISRRHCPFSPVITAPLSHIRSHQQKAIWSRAECSTFQKCVRNTSCPLRKRNKKLSSEPSSMPTIPPPC